MEPSQAPTGTPPSTPPTQQSPPPPVPPAVPPPVAPPVGPTMQEGGEVDGKKWDWLQIGMLVFGATVFSVAIWSFITKARQSKKLANTQEGLEARIAILENTLKKMTASSGNLMPI